MNRVKLCLVVLAPLLLAATCAQFKPIVRTIDDVARWMCAQHHSQLQGVSLEDAWEGYCRAREDWAPWIDPLLQAQAAGTMAAQAPSAQPSAAPGASAAPLSTASPAAPKPPDSAPQGPPNVPAPGSVPSASAGAPDAG